MERCEYVFSDIRPLVSDQLEEQLGESTLRYVTTSLNIQPTSPELHRNLSFVKLGFTHDDQQSKPQYQMVLDGQDDQKERDVDNVPAELTSVPTEEHPIEEMQLQDGGNTQDSDDTDSDFSTLNSQPSSLNHPMFDSQHSEDNQVVTPIDGEEREVNWSVEEIHKGENDVQVITGVPVECEDKSIKPVVVLATPKIVQDTVDFEQPKQEQQDVAKVLYRSNDWQAEFPLDQVVSVKRDEKEYQHAIFDSKGCLKTLIYKKVTPVNREIFNKWKQLDDNVHCDSVVAYLEDENCGYLVKEHLENGMAMVANKIISDQKTVAEDIAKFDKSKRQTAHTMSQWRGRLKEQQRLRQLLRDLVTGVINVDECLHQLGFVSLNLHVRNLFVRFSCNCWATPTCVHGSSGVTVVIRNCELAYPVGSVVDGPTTSKALELLDSMHKYKRAETIYDNLDLVIFVIKLLTKISGSKSCKRKLNAWVSNITNGVFTDPPVEDVQQLCEECGIAQNDTIKMIDYLKESAVHYTRLYGEHEV